jgi:hypothetical protein
MHGSRRVQQRENHPMVSGCCFCIFLNHSLNDISISRSAEKHTIVETCCQQGRTPEDQCYGATFRDLAISYYLAQVTMVL